MDLDTLNVKATAQQLLTLWGQIYELKGEDRPTAARKAHGQVTLWLRNAGLNTAGIQRTVVDVDAWVNEYTSIEFD